MYAFAFVCTPTTTTVGVSVKNPAGNETGVYTALVMPLTVPRRIRGGRGGHTCGLTRAPSYQTPTALQRTTPDGAALILNA